MNQKLTNIDNLKTMKDINDELMRRGKLEHEQFLADMKLKAKSFGVGFVFGLLMMAAIWSEYTIYQILNGRG